MLELVPAKCVRFSAITKIVGVQYVEKRKRPRATNTGQKGIKRAKPARIHAAGWEAGRVSFVAAGQTTNRARTGRKVKIRLGWRRRHEYLYESGERPYGTVATKPRWRLAQDARLRSGSYEDDFDAPLTTVNHTRLLSLHRSWRDTLGTRRPPPQRRACGPRRPTPSSCAQQKHHIHTRPVPRRTQTPPSARAAPEACPPLSLSTAAATWPTPDARLSCCLLLLAEMFNALHHHGPRTSTDDISDHFAFSSRPASLALQSWPRELQSSTEYSTTSSPPAAVRPLFILPPPENSCSHHVGDAISQHLSFDSSEPSFRRCTAAWASHPLNPHQPSAPPGTRANRSAQTERALSPAPFILRALC